MPILAARGRLSIDLTETQHRLEAIKHQVDSQGLRSDAGQHAQTQSPVEALDSVRTALATTVTEPTKVATVENTLRFFGQFSRTQW